MTTNIVNAMGAVKNLEDHPKTSTSLTLIVAINAGVDAGAMGKSVGASANFSGGATINYDSKDSILRAVKDANDRIQLSLVSKLNTMVTPTSRFPDGTALGKAPSVEPYSNMAANFGGRARSSANSAARSHYQTTFPKRGGIFFSYSYPSEFNADH